MGSRAVGALVLLLDLKFVIIDNGEVSVFAIEVLEFFFLLAGNGILLFFICVFY